MSDQPLRVTHYELSYHPRVTELKCRMVCERGLSFRVFPHTHLFAESGSWMVDAGLLNAGHGHDAREKEILLSRVYGLLSRPERIRVLQTMLTQEMQDMEVAS